MLTEDLDGLPKKCFCADKGSIRIRLMKQMRTMKRGILTVEKFESRQLLTGTPWGNDARQVLPIGDWDGDGFDDIAVVTGDADSRIYLGGPSGIESDRFLVSPNTPNKIYSNNDFFDLRGDLDRLVSREDGSFQSFLVSYSSSCHRTEPFCPEDYVLWGRGIDGVEEVSSRRFRVFSDEALLFTLSDEPGSSDVNGDGIQDVIEVDCYEVSTVESTAVVTGTVFRDGSIAIDGNATLVSVSFEAGSGELSHQGSAPWQQLISADDSVSLVSPGVEDAVQLDGELTLPVRFTGDDVSTLRGDWRDVAGNVHDIDLTFEPCGLNQLVGDTDADGDVDFKDFLRLAMNFGQRTDAAFANGDFDCDGNVDSSDFLALANYFGK